MDVPGLTEILTSLANGIGVGAVIAFLFEKFVWFQNLTGSARWWIIFGLSMGLPMIAQLLVQFVPPDVWVVLEPYWRTLAAGFLTWAGTQITHLIGRKLRE